MLKQIVLQLANTFPLKHRSEGQETFFRQNFLSGRKIHTIRTGYEKWRHNIDKVNNGGYCISVRRWSGLPFKSKQEEIRKLVSVGYQRISMSYDHESKTLRAVIDGKPYMGDVKLLAKNDGLKWEDFVDYFFGKCAHSETLFQGVIIHFTDFRY